MSWNGDWKLWIQVLSAQQNLQEAEAVADIALYEAEKEDQMGILRLKAQIQASRGQFKSAVESFSNHSSKDGSLPIDPSWQGMPLFTVHWNTHDYVMFLLSEISTCPSQVKSLQKWEMEAWLDLASIYTKLEALEHLSWQSSKWKEIQEIEMSIITSALIRIRYRFRVGIGSQRSDLLSTLLYARILTYLSFALTALCESLSYTNFHNKQQFMYRNK
jgi:hypothetical protein